MKQEIPPSIRRQVLSEYYKARASKAGSVKSPAKKLASARARLVTGKRLRSLARKHPELAGDIEAYLMASQQEKALTRMALVEKLEKIAN